MEKFLSIIIPVYNIEKYIGQCLDSIIKSNLRNIIDFEIILVIGQSSTDNSDEICKEYGSKFEFIKTVDAMGKGVSRARNIGFENSCGEYVLYVDGDDFLSSKAFYDVIYKMSTDSTRMDVAVFDYSFYIEETNTYRKIEQVGANNDALCGLNAFSDTLLMSYPFWNIWRYIYRKEFLKKNSIRYLEDINVGEDLDYIVSVLLANPQICFYNASFYNYRIGRVGSSTSSSNRRYFDDTVTVLRSAIQRLEASKFYSFDSITERLRLKYILHANVAYELRKFHGIDVYCQYSDNLDMVKNSKKIKYKLMYYVLKSGLLYPASFIMYKIKILGRK